jgi:hypothetical protein
MQQLHGKPTNRPPEVSKISNIEIYQPLPTHGLLSNTLAKNLFHSFRNSTKLFNMESLEPRTGPKNHRVFVTMKLLKSHFHVLASRPPKPTDLDLLALVDCCLKDSARQHSHHKSAQSARCSEAGRLWPTLGDL